jgi:predicted nucleotidyltransferase
MDQPKNIVLDPNLPWLAQRIIFLTKHGSHAYGTSTPTSDLDIRGIAVAPLRYHFGFIDRFEQSVMKNEEGVDLVIQDLRKFIALATKANPSVLEVLYTDPSDHLIVHPLAAKLIECRDWFLSQRVLHSFTGFAMAHVNDISRREVAKTGRWYAEEIPSPPSKRKPLYEKYGYDTKDAAHVVRVLRMCKEILTGQGVIVKRPDAEELLAIKNGAWKAEEVISWAHEMDKELHLLRDNTKLPPEPDQNLINELCTELVAGSFAHQINIPVMLPGFEHQTMQFEAGVLVEKKLSADRT